MNQNIKQKEQKANPATIQFFAIFEKNKPVRVLPAFLNQNYLSMKDMNELKMGEVLQGRVIIPKEPEPWSLISEDADLIFLCIQSRANWISVLTPETNLLKVEAVRTEVEKIENSLNNFSWRKDYFAGKFNIPSPSKQEKKIEHQKEEPKEESKKSGINPGSNWK